MPRTDRLTQQILSGTHAVKHRGGYVVGDGPPVNDWEIVEPEILVFVQELYDRAEGFYGKYDDPRVVNYEDIAFLADQVASSLDFEYENPALDPFIADLADRVASGDEHELGDRANKAREYIIGSVVSLLQRPPKELGHLNLVVEACESSDAEQIDIVTVIHDTVLEQVLQQSRIAYSDGFEETINDKTRAWSNTFSESVKLLKLHGSVDWYRTRWQGQQTMIRTADDPWHLVDNAGNQIDPPADGRAQILAGTFNKILSYPSPVYLEQHGHFRAALDAADAVVVSGYSFGDKAINTQLVGFLRDGSARPFVVIHENPKEAIAKARPAIYYAVAAAGPRCRGVSAWVEAVGWADLEEALG
jgi:hypothetical protein